MKRQLSPLLVLVIAALLAALALVALAEQAPGEEESGFDEPPVLELAAEPIEEIAPDDVPEPEPTEEPIEELLEPEPTEEPVEEQPEPEATEEPEEEPTEPVVPLEPETAEEPEEEPTEPVVPMEPEATEEPPVLETSAVPVEIATPPPAERMETIDEDMLIDNMMLDIGELITTMSLNAGEESYTVTIPDSASINSEELEIGPITVSGLNIDLGKSLTVTVASKHSFNMVLESSTETIPYYLSVREDGSDTAKTVKENGATVIEVEGGTGTESGEWNLTLVPEGTAPYVGTYTDTLTFTVHVVE